MKLESVRKPYFILDPNNQTIGKEELVAYRQTIEPDLFTEHWSKVRNLFELIDLEKIRFDKKNLYNERIEIGSATDLNEAQTIYFRELLKLLIPWRVGPYSIFDINIDTEWRSFYKWNRLKDVHCLIKGKRVLDLGANNGYFMLRMLEHEPYQVYGWDPSERTYFQFLILYLLLRDPRIFFDRFTHKQLRNFPNYFELIFSLGVLYHQKNPFKFLRGIKDSLTSKGQLVLETIILEGPSNMVLSVPDRYCMMRNVYWIPTESALITWFKRSGFKNIEILAKDEVTNKEQSKTDYAPFFSLDEFSNQKDPSLTIEGFPAPIRVSLIAK